MLIVFKLEANQSKSKREIDIEICKIVYLISHVHLSMT